MAYEIIKRLEQEKETTLLSRLAENIEISRKENNKLHNIWELSFDWKHCESEKFINQKLDYYHINPVKGVWNLCESPVNYKHSSAQFCMENSHAFMCYKLCGCAVDRITEVYTTSWLNTKPARDVVTKEEVSSWNHVHQLCSQTMYYCACQSKYIRQYKLKCL